MTLTQMRGYLDRRGIQLTKSLGQNFLHDSHQLKRIVDLAQLVPEDKVLEIGPGLGPLTEHIFPRVSEVLAIEKDERLVRVLVERFGLETRESEKPNDLKADDAEPGDANQPQNLFLLLDDALDYLKREPRDWSEWKLVANLPYSVASPILVELAAGPRAPKLISVTLQLEVAKRLMASADADDYGVLTLLVQLDFEPQQWFKIPADCFFPVPDVDSACVCLKRRDVPLLDERGRVVFYKLVKLAFSQRRKMMLKLLKQQWPKEKLEAVFGELKIPVTERAEKLNLLQFVELTKRLMD